MNKDNDQKNEQQDEIESGRRDFLKGGAIAAGAGLAASTAPGLAAAGGSGHGSEIGREGGGRGNDSTSGCDRPPGPVVLPGRGSGAGRNARDTDGNRLGEHHPARAARCEHLR